MINLVLFKVSDYPGGFCVFGGGFERLVSLDCNILGKDIQVSSNFPTASFRE